MARVLREGAFEGETHIVTGAAQGIGLAVATALAEHGAQLLLVDLDEGRLAEAAAEIGKAAKVKPIFGLTCTCRRPYWVISTGSSAVQIFMSTVLIAPSAEWSVVVFPEPVGPTQRTSP